MPKCSFSGKDIPAGTGIMYVKTDGKVLYFADSKCEKNYLKLGRKPRHIAWTEEARAAKRAALATGHKPAEKIAHSSPKTAEKKTKANAEPSTEGEDT
jgi:large subunit ribosomal protein L24e